MLFMELLEIILIVVAAVVGLGIGIGLGIIGIILVCLA